MLKYYHFSVRISVSAIQSVAEVGKITQSFLDFTQFQVTPIQSSFRSPLTVERFETYATGTTVATIRVGSAAKLRA